MTRILNELPWKEIINDTLAELEEEARASDGIDAFNVEDEFDAETVLDVLSHMIHKRRSDLPNSVTDNLISQLFRGNRYMKTPQGPRQLSKTAKELHVVAHLLRQLAIRLGAHDPDFDLTNVLKVNFRTGGKIQSEPVLDDDGLTDVQRIFRGFGTDELELILAAVNEAFGGHIQMHEKLKQLFATFTEKALFYSPVMFVRDLDAFTRSSLQDSALRYVFTESGQKLNPLDRTSLLLSFWIQMSNSNVTDLEQQSQTLAQAKAKSMQMRRLLGVVSMTKTDDRIWKFLQNLQSNPVQPQKSPVAIHKKILNAEDQLGVNDMRDFYEIIKTMYVGQVADQSSLAKLVADLEELSRDELPVKTGLMRIKKLAATRQETSEDELKRIYQDLFSDKNLYNELAFDLSLIVSESMLTSRKKYSRQKLIDQTFRTMLMYSDARHQWQAEKIDQTKHEVVPFPEAAEPVVEEIFEMQQPEVYVVSGSLALKREPVFGGIQNTYSYPKSKLHWQHPHMLRNSDRGPKPSVNETAGSISVNEDNVMYFPHSTNSAQAFQPSSLLIEMSLNSWMDSGLAMSLSSYRPHL